MAQRRFRGGSGVSSDRRSFGAGMGFALFMLCCMLTIWGGLPLLERTGLTLLSLLTWCSVPLFATMAGMLIVQAYLHAIPRPFARIVDAVSQPEPACGLIIGSYCVLVFLGRWSGEGAASAFGVLAGAGIASLMMRWEIAFDALSADVVVKTVLAALVVHSVLFASLALAPQPVLEAVFVASAVGSTVLLRVFERADASDPPDGGKRRPSGWQPDDSTSQAHREKPSLGFGSLFGALRNPIFCVAATVFAVAITRTMALQTVPHMVAAVGIVSSIGAAVVGGILWLVLIRPRASDGKNPAIGITSLYRFMFPVIATAVLVLSVFNGTELAVTMLMYAVFSVLFALMMPSCLELAHREKADVRFVFGIFAGIVYAAFSAGAVTSVVLYHARIFDAPIPLIGALLVLYALSMAYAGMQRGRKSRNETRDLDKEAGDTKQVPPQSESLEDRCDAVAMQFDLSPREKDVLIAFSHGRNVAYLAERLCLSENTIRSHSKSLYTKLGIHSKQELLDLIEGDSKT